jgi:hypothetical protein
MKLPLALLGLLVCALPLLAENDQRRVVAACELTTASVVPSGKESKSEGREFAIRVNNNSLRTIAIPRSPIFGWRVEVLEKKEWRLKAEGGPVRRVNAKDEHIVVLGGVLGNPETSPLLEIPPTGSADFYAFLPEAEKALQSDKQRASFKLTLYWAAPEALAKSNPAIPLCALAPEWKMGLQNVPAIRK